jgi:hypothetical protein
MSRSVGKNMASGGMLSLARLLTGVVRVKIIALALGASGVGIYSVLLPLSRSFRWASPFPSLISAAGT